MAPKAKPSAKVKKDEVIEVPKTAAIPDGKKTFFVGGWSSFTSLRALNDITSQFTEAGDTVVLLPGEIDGEGVLELRALTVGGQSCFAKLAAQRAEASKGAADDDGAGDGARGADGDAKEATSTDDEPLDRSVVVRGHVTVTAWKPPPPPAPTPVAPSPPVPAPKKSGASSKTVKIDDEPPAPPPREPDPPEVGVAPSTWPTVTFDSICFIGGVTVKGIHAVFKRCSFASTTTPHQLAVHQYCKVTVEQCRFDVPQRHSLYCFPKSAVNVSKSFFGADQQRQRAPTDAASTTTAVYCDDASLQLSSSTFHHVGFGVVLHDKCEGTVVSRCTFDGIEATGLTCQGSGGVADVRSNTFKRCGYYAMQFTGDGKSRPTVVCNTVSSTVRVHKGARPTLHTNKLDVAVIDDNATSPAYLNPTY